MTTSEAARHGRAELETIAAGLQVTGLARLLEVARRLLEEQDAPPIAVAFRCDSAACSRRVEA